MRKRLRNYANHFLDWCYQFSLKQYGYLNRSLTIIQVGANDGSSLDFMNQLIRLPKSTSLVIEPVPHIFKKLQDTYKNFDNVTGLQIAVVENEETDFRPFYFLRPVEGEQYLDMYSLWGSFSKEHVLYFKDSVPNFDELFTEVSIPCKSINTIFKESSFNSLDILAIDTEGYDGKIIASINFRIFKPAVILFEHYHIPKSELFELLKSLDNIGYRCYSHGYDTICFDKREKLSGIVLRLVKTFFPGLLTPAKN